MKIPIYETRSSTWFLMEGKHRLSKKNFTKVSGIAYRYFPESVHVFFVPDEYDDLYYTIDGFYIRSERNT